MSDVNPIPIINNSKKISQIRGRDSITYHQEHSWLVLAQYNDKIAAYHNVAMNLSAVTGYSISVANEMSSYIIMQELDKLVTTYGLEGFLELSYIGKQNNYDSIGYAISNSAIASNIVSYEHSYTMQTIMWEYYPTKDETFNIVKYLYTESGTHLLTDKGKMIIV